MSDSLKLYELSDKYVSFLHQADKRVQLNTGDDYSYSRKYLGVVLNVGDVGYFDVRSARVG